MIRAIIMAAANYAVAAVLGLIWGFQSGLAKAATGYGYFAVKAAAKGGPTFLIIGAGGRSATSTDGLNWTLQTSLAGLSVVVSSARVVWAGTQFIVIGDGSAGCATSPDGVTWTAQSGLVAAVGSGNFPALFFDGTYTTCAGPNATAITSDGVNWNPRNSPMNGAFMWAMGVQGSTLVPGGCLNVGSAKYIAFYSPNSAANMITSTSDYDSYFWNSDSGIESAVPHTSGQCLLLLKGGATWLWVGTNGTVATSSDASTWTARTASWTGSMTAGVWTGSKFVLTGTGVNGCATSPDGITWTNVALPSAGYATNNVMSNMLWDGTTALTFGDAAGGLGLCLTSTASGASWTPRNFEVSGGAWAGVAKAAASNASMFIIAGNPGVGASLPAASVSTDGGVNWVDRNSALQTSGLSGVVTAVGCNATRIVALTQGGGTAYSDNNGASWTSSGSISGWGAQTPNKVIWTGTQFVAVCGSQGRVATSVNGSAWVDQGANLQATAFGAAVNIGGVAFGATHVVVGSTGKCATSPTGTTWTNQTGLNTIFAGAAAIDLAWNGTVYCAISTTLTATSPDGVTWTNRTGMTGALGSSPAIAMNWTGTRFLVVAASGQCATSPDGITWTGTATLSPLLGGSAPVALTNNTSRALVVTANNSVATS